MAHLIASMANKIEPEFFCPNEGRVCEATEENIASAKSGTLQVSAEFLISPGVTAKTANQHFNPTTGSMLHYALYDWFHQFNTKKPKEVLRKCSLVQEIAGLIDTQAVEQLFSTSKRDIYFINSYSPTKHLFVFRLMCHLRNEAKNSLQIQRHFKCFGDCIEVNEFGQLCQYINKPQTIGVDIDIKSEIKVESEEVKQEKTEMEILHESQAYITHVTKIGEKRSISVHNRSLEQTDNNITQFLSFIVEHKDYIIVETGLTEIDLDSFIDLFLAARESINDMTDTEFQNFSRNCNYANSVLFHTPEAIRELQVHFNETEFGWHYVQGFTNYCGLCCANNALHFVEEESFNEIKAKEMDVIADVLWVEMANNPALGISNLIEPMRDKEGFYSVEVLSTLFEQKGYTMSRVDQRTVQGLSPEEIGSYVVKTVNNDIGFVCLIVRPRNEQHWVTLTAESDILLYRDSHLQIPRLLTYAELGDILKSNMVMPGSVFFLSKTPAARNGLKELSSHSSGTVYETCQVKAEKSSKNEELAQGDSGNADVIDIDNLPSPEIQKSVGEMGGIQLYQDDVSRLQEKKLLNDQLVNAYLRCFEEKGRILVLDSFNLEKYCLLPEEAKSSPIVLIPIHSPGHWSLAVIFNRTQTFAFLDPIGRRKNTTCKAVDSIRQFYKESFDMDIKEDKRYDMIKINQGNRFDCGVYVLEYARRIVHCESLADIPKQKGALRLQIKKTFLEVMACKECCSCKNWIKDYEAEEKSDRFICRSCSSWGQTKTKKSECLKKGRKMTVLKPRPSQKYSLRINPKKKEKRSFLYYMKPKKSRASNFNITDLPSELLSLILKEVVLSDGDTAYLKLSLVCKKFQCIITREGFKKGCHFDWLLSLKPKGFWDKHRDRFLPFDIRTCRSCGSVFKYEPSLYWGGHGIRGEFVGSYDSIPNPSFCCAFCEAIEDNYNDSIE